MPESTAGKLNIILTVLQVVVLTEGRVVLPLQKDPEPRQQWSDLGILSDPGDFGGWRPSSMPESAIVSVPPETPLTQAPGSESEESVDLDSKWGTRAYSAEGKGRSSKLSNPLYQDPSIGSALFQPQGSPPPPSDVGEHKKFTFGDLGKGLGHLFKSTAKKLSSMFSAPSKKEPEVSKKESVTSPTFNRTNEESDKFVQAIVVMAQFLNKLENKCKEHQTNQTEVTLTSSANGGLEGTEETNTEGSSLPDTSEEREHRKDSHERTSSDKYIMSYTSPPQTSHQKEASGESTSNVTLLFEGRDTTVTEPGRREESSQGIFFLGTTQHNTPVPKTEATSQQVQTKEEVGASTGSTENLKYTSTTRVEKNKEQVEISTERSTQGLELTNGTSLAQTERSTTSGRIDGNTSKANIELNEVEVSSQATSTSTTPGMTTSGKTITNIKLEKEEGATLPIRGIVAIEVSTYADIRKKEEEEITIRKTTPSGSTSTSVGGTPQAKSQQNAATTPFPGSSTPRGTSQRVKEKEEVSTQKVTQLEGSTCATEGSTRATEGSTCATEGSTRANEGSTRATEGSTRATKGNTRATEGSTRATEGSTLATEGSTLATEGSTRATEGSTRATEGSTRATEGSTRATEGSTRATEGSTPATEGSTPGTKSQNEVSTTFDGSGPGGQSNKEEVSTQQTTPLESTATTKVGTPMTQADQFKGGEISTQRTVPSDRTATTEVSMADRSIKPTEYSTKAYEVNTTSESTKTSVAGKKDQNEDESQSISQPTVPLNGTGTTESSSLRTTTDRDNEKQPSEDTSEISTPETKTDQNEEGEEGSSGESQVPVTIDWDIFSSITDNTPSTTVDQLEDEDLPESPFVEIGTGETPGSVEDQIENGQTGSLPDIAFENSGPSVGSTPEGEGELVAEQSVPVTIDWDIFPSLYGGYEGRSTHLDDSSWLKGTTVSSDISRLQKLLYRSKEGWGVSPPRTKPEDTVDEEFEAKKNVDSIYRKGFKEQNWPGQHEYKEAAGYEFETTLSGARQYIHKLLNRYRDKVALELEIDTTERPNKSPTLNELFPDREHATVPLDLLRYDPTTGHETVTPERLVGGPFSTQSRQGVHESVTKILPGTPENIVKELLLGEEHNTVNSVVTKGTTELHRKLFQHCKNIEQLLGAMRNKDPEAGTSKKHEKELLHGEEFITQSIGRGRNKGTTSTKTDRSEESAKDSKHPFGSGKEKEIGTITTEELQELLQGEELTSGLLPGVESKIDFTANRTKLVNVLPPGEVILPFDQFFDSFTKKETLTTVAPQYVVTKGLSATTVQDGVIYEHERGTPGTGPASRDSMEEDAVLLSQRNEWTTELGMLPFDDFLEGLTASTKAEEEEGEENEEQGSLEEDSNQILGKSSHTLLTEKRPHEELIISMDHYRHKLTTEPGTFSSKNGKDPSPEEDGTTLLRTKWYDEEQGDDPSTTEEAALPSNHSIHKLSARSIAEERDPLKSKYDKNGGIEDEPLGVGADLEGPGRQLVREVQAEKGASVRKRNSGLLGTLEWLSKALDHTGAYLPAGGPRPEPMVKVSQARGYFQSRGQKTPHDPLLTPYVVPDRAENSTLAPLGVVARSNIPNVKGFTPWPINFAQVLQPNDVSGRKRVIDRSTPFPQYSRRYNGPKTAENTAHAHHKCRAEAMNLPGDTIEKEPWSSISSKRRNSKPTSLEEGTSTPDDTLSIHITLSRPSTNERLLQNVARQRKTQAKDLTEPKVSPTHLPRALEDATSPRADMSVK